MHAEEAAGTNAATNTEVRVLSRRRALVALALGWFALSAAVPEVSAQSRNRMDPGERERLRRELRQHDERRRGDDGARRAGDERRRDRDDARRGNDPRRTDDARRGDGGRDRNRLSTPEREELRRQLRDARPDERRGRARR